MEIWNQNTYIEIKFNEKEIEGKGDVYRIAFNKTFLAEILLELTKGTRPIKINEKNEKIILRNNEKIWEIENEENNRSNKSKKTNEKR